MTGQWIGEGNPTRADCIRLAAECATRAVDDYVNDPAQRRVYAEAAKAWAAIAEVAENVVQAEQQSQGPTVEDDIKRCGHGAIAWLSPAGAWVHPGSVTRCDRPPTG